MKLLPMPWMSFAIVALWLVLVSAFTLNSLAMGLVVALAIPLLTQGLWPDRPVLRRPWLAVPLFARVCGDIVAANFVLARQVLGPLDRLHPQFLEIPLDIEDPFVASILAGIVTLTPGTLSVDIDLPGRILHVHAFNASDTVAMSLAIKARYEAPLKEIFGC